MRNFWINMQWKEKFDKKIENKLLHFNVKPLWYSEITTMYRQYFSSWLLKWCGPTILVPETRHQQMISNAVIHIYKRISRTSSPGKSFHAHLGNICGTTPAPSYTTMQGIPARSSSAEGFQSGFDQFDAWAATIRSDARRFFEASSFSPAMNQHRIIINKRSTSPWPDYKTNGYNPL